MTPSKQSFQCRHHMLDHKLLNSTLSFCFFHTQFRDLCTNRKQSRQRKTVYYFIHIALTSTKKIILCSCQPCLQVTLPFAVALAPYINLLHTFVHTYTPSVCTVKTQARCEHSWSLLPGHSKKKKPTICCTQEF